MELYEVENDAEKALRDKADRAYTPFGGCIELLPVCNMDCKMCYVRMSREEMDRAGRMLSCDEWLTITRQAADMGVMNLLLTGGEPLLYPEFKRLYRGLQQMGIILSVNTNGTLIDEEWADFFAESYCRRISISLYGKDDATYGELCRNPKGFSQVMRAAELLKARGVPFRFTCSVTEDNAADLPELFAIAKRVGVPLQPATYMFPALRRGISAQQQVRLGPERAAQLMFESYRHQMNEEEMKQSVARTLTRLLTPPRMPGVNGKGFTCHTGRSGFWLTWKGEMIPCGMLDEPRFSLLEHGFADCWKQLVEATGHVVYPRECLRCPLQNICHVCPAALVAETGSTEIVPQYVCRYTKELVRQMQTYLLPELKQNEPRER